MAAVIHARLITGEQEWGERLRPHRQAKHVVAENALGDEFADGFELAIRALGLLVVLDRARGEARGSSAIDERRTREKAADGFHLVRRKHVRDLNLHGAARERSKVMGRPPAPCNAGPIPWKRAIHGHFASLE